MKTKDQIQEEALAALSKVRGGTAAMSVGTGKTLVGLKHMDLHYTDTSFFLVVAPKKSIFQSWIDDAKKFGFDYLLDRITFTTYLSLPKQQLHYDAVYLDEAHSLLESHAEWLNAYKGIKIGLTGTPPKFQHSLRGRLFNAHIPVVYNYITDDAVEDKILNDYHIIVHELKLSTAKNMWTGKEPKKWLTSEQDNYNYWTKRVSSAQNMKEKQIVSIQRMKALMSFGSKEHYAKRLLDTMHNKTILFANTQEQAEKFGILTYHSGNPDSEENLERFKRGDILDLACVLQLNEGVNIPNLRTGIIMHAYGNERKASQRIGRLMRLNPKEKSTIHILCYKDTVDETWVKNALEDYDQSKITWTKEYF
ncbi:MAG TPA: DEAD/DEAH box helicase family protein [Candidatus Dojkabacteria bacterium]|nr:DEAD/DEAH box helicase family protein [Candidatus Dojkabacteria bacterium]